MSDCLILYLLDHKAYIAAESTEIPDPDDEWSIQTEWVEHLSQMPHPGCASETHLSR